MVIGSQKECYKCGNYELAGCMNDFPFVCSGCKKLEEVDLVTNNVYDGNMAEELPENTFIDDYVVTVNDDKTETSLTTIFNYWKDDIHKSDTKGNKMNIIAVLHGTTWEEAKKAKNALVELDWKTDRKTNHLMDLSGLEIHYLIDKFQDISMELSSHYGHEHLEKGIYKLRKILEGICNAKNSW